MNEKRQWVEDRLPALADWFAVAIWGDAVMGNHLQVVVQMLPETALNWSDQEVAERWIRLFPRADSSESTPAMRVQAFVFRAYCLR